MNPPTPEQEKMENGRGTPRTDAEALRTAPKGRALNVPIGFARQLERELAGLRGVLRNAKREISSLAQLGTERIQSLGGDCDPWEMTAEITLRRAGITEALPPAGAADSLQSAPGGA